MGLGLDFGVGCGEGEPGGMGEYCRVLGGLESECCSTHGSGLGFLFF